MDDKAVRGIARSFFPTRLGCGAVAASEHGLVEVFLPFGGASREKLEGAVRSRFPGARSESDLTVRAAHLLERYFRGEKVDFQLPLDLPQFPPFRRRVYEIVQTIPYGSVMTYAEVAAMAGSPRGARGVGGAMGANPLPVVVPCHRVVGSAGSLTGYSAIGGISSKKWLLKLEGVKRFGLADQADGKPAFRGDSVR